MDGRRRHREMNGGGREHGWRVDRWHNVRDLSLRDVPSEPQAEAEPWEVDVDVVP